MASVALSAWRWGTVQVVMVIVALLTCAGLYALRRHRRYWRRDTSYLVVTIRPDVELKQPYGGWLPGAYDAGTGHDHSRAAETPVPFGLSARGARR